MIPKKLHVRQGDQVVVISGKDKGKKGKVMTAMPQDGMIVVQGVNMTMKHKKARAAGQQSGRFEKESPIYASKVMPLCGKCDKPTRISHKFLDDGKKVRVCKHCGEQFE